MMRFLIGNADALSGLMFQFPQIRMFGYLICSQAAQEQPHQIKAFSAGHAQ